VFLTNVVFQSSCYESIGWKTKRKGRVAYTTDGEPLAYGYPVFVQEEEILNKPDY
jgi:hypothetical protein